MHHKKDQGELLHELLLRDKYEVKAHGRVILVGNLWELPVSLWSPLHNLYAIIANALPGEFCCEIVERDQDHETAIDLTNSETRFKVSFELDHLGPFVVARFRSCEKVSFRTWSSVVPGYSEAV